MEQTRVLKRNPSSDRQFTGRESRENPARRRFCYDGIVWQRLAIRHGRDAVKHGRVFVKHVVPAVVKPARTLWNEIIGFIFGVFTVIFGFRAGRLFLDYQASAPESQGGSMLRFAVAAFTTVLMAYFAITSFLRARKIARS